MLKLVSYVRRGPTDLYLFNGSRVTVLFSLLMEAALIGNVLFVCTASFSCERIIPTISYTGCLRGHDRFFVFACTAFGLTFPLTCLGLQARFHGALDSFSKGVMTCLGLGCAVTLPILSLVDEVNGLYVLSLSHIHTFLSLSLLVLVFSYTYYVYTGLEAISQALSYDEIKWMRRLKVMYYCAAGLTILTMFQWHFAYTIYSNAFINENVEALCEWTLVSVGVFLPVVYTQFIPGYTISLGVQASLKSGSDA